jgi:hypothetical protein
VRKEIEADTEFSDLADSFLDFRANPVLMKEESRREPADTGPDDRYVVVVHIFELSDGFRIGTQLPK